jgi:hypothetical protein
MRIGALGVAMLVAWGGPGQAGGFVSVEQGQMVVTPATTVSVAEPTPLEWLRYVRPKVGRDVAVVVDGQSVRTIEWRHPVEVRVRTESGVALTRPEQDAVLDLAQVCHRGEPRSVRATTEFNDTFVVEYDCTWLQGYEGQ